MASPRTTHGTDYDVVVVGAGFGGVYQLHRLRELGLSAVVLEAGSGLGGVWHWNCYPGARVDSNVPIYEFSDERVWRSWYWEELYPGRDQLVRYFDHVDDVWDLRSGIEFGTRCTHGRWDEAGRRWELRTDAGETLRARFVVLCTGFASKPYVPDLPGLADFRGDWYHTAWWPQTATDMTGLRVGVVGTGASGVQVIQEAAKVADQVTVFQRTPILALAMQQQRLTAAEQDRAKQSYPEIFRTRLETDSGFGYGPMEESVFSVSEPERLAVFDKLWNEGGFKFWAGNYRDVIIDREANRLAYDFWCEKTRARIHDPKVADLLAPVDPPHPFGVKRPSLEQDYYEAFNQDNVSLVDLRSTPIEAITATGVRTTAGHHDVDLLVMATGFDAVTGGLTSIDLRGSRGDTLLDHWRDGVRTHLGVASSGFPNVFYLYGPQSPSGFCNGPTCAEVQGDWVVDLLANTASSGVTRVEATPEAEEDWRALVERIGAKTLYPLADSWYMGANIPGKRRELLNWPGGLRRYRALCDASAEAGYSGFVTS